MSFQCAIPLQLHRCGQEWPELSTLPAPELTREEEVPPEKYCLPPAAWLVLLHGTPGSRWGWKMVRFDISSPPAAPALGLRHEVNALHSQV